MSLRLLKIFKCVCECGSISDAAKQLYMSQPAVTHAIKELEIRTAIILFDRIGKRLYITEQGKYYYQKVCKLWVMVDELEQTTKDMQEELRIGSSITNASILVPKLLQRFQDEHHKNITVVVQNAATIEEKLLHNEIDLAFLEGPTHNNQLIQEPLFAYEIVLFCGINYPIHDLQPKSISFYKDENWLVREKGSAIRSCLDSAMLLKDQTIHPKWESVNSQALIQAAKANLGICILPRALIKQELSAGTFKLLPLVESLSCVNHVVYHKDKHIHSSMEKLLTLCKNIPSIEL